MSILSQDILNHMFPGQRGMQETMDGVMTTLSTTGQPFLSVLTFGVISGGVPETNRAGFAAAFAAGAALGARVYVPPGTYTVGRDGGAAWMLNITQSNLTVFGVRGASNIVAQAGQPNAAVPVIRLFHCSNVYISDLAISGNWGNTVGGTDANTGINHTSQIDPKNYVIWVYENTSNITIERVDITQAYGDGIWIGGTLSGGGTTKVTVRNVTIDMCARNGVSLAGVNIDGVVLDNVRVTNVFTTALDGEPGLYCKNIEICGGSHWGKWWGVGGGNMGRQAVSIQGGSTGQSGPQNYAENWSLHHCFVEGNVGIFDAKGAHVHDNTIMAVDISGAPPITVQGYCDDIWIENNQIYEKSTNAAFPAAICVLGGGNGFVPGNVTIRGNKIRARNGNHGINVEATSGIAGASGTASATAALSMTDGSASWTPDQFIGLRVRIGSTLSIVKSNTATVLTLIDDGWTDILGTYQVATPAAGPYVIDGGGGLITIDNNQIDCVNDGAGAGGNGIRFRPNAFGTRVSITRNKIRGATGSAISIVPPGTGTNTPKILEIIDNHAYDDQTTPTCTEVVGFAAGTANLGNFTMRGNTQGQGVTNAMVGLTTGVWKLSDGAVPAWAGFGSPETVVAAPVGSTFLRLDGSTSTTLYIKTANTTNTGWTAK